MDGHSSSQWEGEGEASSHVCLYKKVIVHALLLSRYLNVFKKLNGVSHVTPKLDQEFNYRTACTSADFHDVTSVL